MHEFCFHDIRKFRVKLPDPLFPYKGRLSIDAATVDALSDEGSGWKSIGELTGFFTPNFAKRNPLNIPGPIYGAETDTCLTGPSEAPDNVLVDQSGQEFVFRQPASATEFRDLVCAAITECFIGYGADGDEHWRLSSIREWWRGRAAMVGEVGEEWCNPTSVASWRAALKGGAERYLQVYAFFVENGRVARADERLPELN